MWVFLRVEWEIVKGGQEVLRAQEYETDIRGD